MEHRRDDLGDGVMGKMHPLGAAMTVIQLSADGIEMSMPKEAAIALAVHLKGQSDQLSRVAPLIEAAKSVSAALSDLIDTGSGATYDNVDEMHRMLRAAMEAEEG